MFGDPNQGPIPQIRAEIQTLLKVRDLKRPGVLGDINRIAKRYGYQASSVSSTPTTDERRTSRKVILYPLTAIEFAWGEP